MDPCKCPLTVDPWLGVMGSMGSVTVIIKSLLKEAAGGLGEGEIAGLGVGGGDVTGEE